MIDSSRSEQRGRGGRSGRPGGPRAGDPADFIAALNKNGGSPFSDLGDSFYTAAVDKMFYTPPETDELGYSNSFDRWLGENLIRPAVGDDNLINASDAELFSGTAAFATAAAVTIVYCRPGHRQHGDVGWEQRGRYPGGHLFVGRWRGGQFRGDGDRGTH